MRLFILLHTKDQHFISTLSGRRRMRHLDIRDALLQSPSLSDSTDVAGRTDINVLPQMMDVNVG